jgi:hypothetical protein
MYLPSVVGHIEMLPENGFRPPVIEVNTICEGMKALGRCRLRRHLRSMQHERCVCASLSYLAPRYAMALIEATVPILYRLNSIGRARKKL